MKGKLTDKNNPPNDQDRQRLEADASRLEKEIDSHIQQYNEHYPGTEDLNILAAKQAKGLSSHLGLQRGGVTGGQAAAILRG